jgi:hypothetical protein
MVWHEAFSDIETEPKEISTQITRISEDMEAHIDDYAHSPLRAFSTCRRSR